MSGWIFLHKQSAKPFEEFHCNFEIACKNIQTSQVTANKYISWKSYSINLLPKTLMKEEKD